MKPWRSLVSTGPQLTKQTNPMKSNLLRYMNPPAFWRVNFSAENASAVPTAAPSKVQSCWAVSLTAVTNRSAAPGKKRQTVTQRVGKIGKPGPAIGGRLQQKSLPTTYALTN
jgi:hypothetical protein